MILASAVAAALSEEIGIIVWAASGLLGLVYGLAVVWSVRRQSPARAAARAASSAPAASSVPAAARASAQAVAAAEQLLAAAASDAAGTPAPARPAPAPSSSGRLAGGFPTSAGHSGVVAQPASA
ncbi:hypothetical protein SA2016_2936 [Sinomonas atrocyanea]|uniref:Uncharacterized protein n=1 Tax=Sinomonas atrocyanea TaxID=37927 RepID=A0A127A3X3_9MICC|nr:hypothetical protein SA2016_2936 [Sinomonas atrocyanea]GEB63271.1 hypothetical protein SAT01_07190 [Sinomonas atrocyanea]GGG52865.1 hypothetical protein GCM10007172_00040 [Sinomonas atrocyanea]